MHSSPRARQESGLENVPYTSSLPPASRYRPRAPSSTVTTPVGRGKSLGTSRVGVSGGRSVRVPLARSSTAMSPIILPPLRETPKDSQFRRSIRAPKSRRLEKVRVSTYKVFRSGLASVRPIDVKGYLLRL